MPNLFFFLVTAKKLSSDLESPHFPTFSEKMLRMQNWRDGHGKSINGHGKVMEKYVVKYVGTLSAEMVLAERESMVLSERESMGRVMAYMRSYGIANRSSWRVLAVSGSADTGQERTIRHKLPPS